MAIVLVLRERLRRANHLILMREGWENWLFWYTLIQDCLTLCTCFFRSTCVCTCFFFSEIAHPPFKKTVALFRDFLMEKFLPLLLRKKKVLERIRRVLYSVFLITCDLVSLYCFKFLLSLPNFLSSPIYKCSILHLLHAKFCCQNSFTWSFNFLHALEGYCWLFVC